MATEKRLWLILEEVDGCGEFPVGIMYTDEKSVSKFIAQKRSEYCFYNCWEIDFLDDSSAAFAEEMSKRF